ncbi:MAG TPA: response regulator [Salinisphaera sp.]|nr:response regulator [Salinisphaera sp.]
MVDDDPGFAMSTAALLNSDGFDTRLFDCAESFIAARDTPPFCCIMVDWVLPGMNGPTLCERLAAQESHPPLILMSGTMFNEHDLEQRSPLGIEFLRKPFDPEGLLAQLSSLCGRSA